MSDIDSPENADHGDFETATHVLDMLRDEGIAESFTPGDAPGSLRCGACETTSDAAAFEILTERRLEGTSDPDDMVIVVGGRCPACHAAGAVVLGYGPEASESDSDIVQALPS